MTPPAGARLDDLLRARLAPAGGPFAPHPGLRDAAVLAPLFSRGGEDWLLLTKRREDLPDHPGQVSFPGGAREGGEGPLACALRETEEEIGVSAATVVPLGRLPDRLSIAGFMVAAFAGRIPEPRDLRPDAREVERVLEVPVRLLLEESRWRFEDRTTARGTFRGIPHFDWDGPAIWGLTGLFVRDLLEALRGEGPGAPPPPAAAPRTAGR